MLKTTIPFIDLRGRTPTDLLRSFPDTAARLIAANRRVYGLFSQLLACLVLPFSDRMSHVWLKRTKNPYLHEIEAAADIIGKRGVYTLNIAYEWGCTGGAYRAGDHALMLRILDWPFPSLGKYAVIALQNSAAGEFYNITWPALSGVYQGMAPGRFAAAINQAPMRKFGLGYFGDWLVSRIAMRRQKGLPPSHLLRQVFEQAKNYHEAKEILCNTPVAAPVIFTLTGLKPGEGCVIERLATLAEIQELSAAQLVTCSNEFHSRFAAYGKGWRPRMTDSAGRYKQSLGVSVQELMHPDFGWLRPPMLNIYTRLVMRADALSGTMLVQGYEGQSAVTEPFTLQKEKADD